MRKRFALGGIAQSNLEQMQNSVVSIKHHVVELGARLKSNPEIPAWVLSKTYRASEYLADITHYLESEMTGKKYCWGGKMADGGSIAAQNLAMEKNITEAIKHHVVELEGMMDKKPEVEGWVIGKLTVAAKDLMDVTHYLEGEAKTFADGGMMAKGGELPFENSNLYLNGFGMDTNGNSVVKVSFPNQRAFSIQTNGVLKETHNLYTKNVDELSNSQKKIIEKEVVEYVKEFGSDEQKRRLKTYSSYAKGGKIDYSKQTSDDFKLGEIVWDTDNKTYGTIIGIYDEYLSDKYEVRLDTDGMQPTENLRKLGCEGDKGTKEQLLDEIDGYARLVKSFPKNNYPKQIEPKMTDGGMMAKGGEITREVNSTRGGNVTPKEKMIKELQKLQRDLNSSRLSQYREGDTSEEEMARQRERASKLARFNEILKELDDDDNKMADGGVTIYKEEDLNRRDGKLKKTQVTTVENYREALERIKELESKNKNPNIKYYTGNIYREKGGYMAKGGEERGKMAKGGKVRKKYWIQDALSGDHKGALRETAKRKHLIKGDENLSKADLHKLEKMGGKIARRAYMAETLRKFK